MDGNRFDDLSRTLAAGVSRRSTLKAAAIGLLGALGLRAGAQAQVSVTQCNNVRCRNNPERCNDGCVCCVFANGNNRCLPPGKCRLGTEICPDGEVVDSVLGCVPDETGPIIVTGSLDESDSAFSGCDTELRYDAFIFQHPGGPLSLAARGVGGGGGTLEDPILSLYAGAGIPADQCTTPLAFANDGGCGSDAYLELDLAAGTYTVTVSGVANTTGTYTFERNTFTGGACP